MKKSILLFFVFLFISTVSFAQLNDVIYTVEYNETTNLFDCKMYVEGNATTAMERLQISGKYSIVAETGTTLTVAESYFPIYDNETYTGTEPTVWSIANTAINPTEFPGYDVFEIVPEISGQPSHYNNLSGEDEITLFSLVAEGDDICNLSLRAFENDDDPNSIGGNDYSNTMMIGTTDEIYYGNEAADGIWADLDISITEGSVCIGECITLTATFNCIFPGMTYVWDTGETTESITVCPDGSSEYILFISAPFEFSSEVTTWIIVDEGIITAGITDLCAGEQVSYQPESGIWSSSDESIVTVTNEGVLMPLTQGSAVISHTTSAGFCLEEVAVNVLDPEPPEIVGTDELCVDDVTQLLPNSGVTWVSGNTSVATIDDTGLVTGVGLGVTVFSYTTNQGQCTSEQSQAVSVFQIPEPIITGLDTICVGEMTTLTPQAGVTWVSSDISIATIDNSGNVTGVAEGRTTFSFTDMANGCTSDESEPVTVLPAPYVQLSADSVCVGDIVGADATNSSEEGSWLFTVISGNQDIANINDSGLIETNGPGVVSVQYLNENGCLSWNFALLTIFPKPNPQISSNSPICIGENLLLTATIPAGVNYSYEWTGPNNFFSEVINPIITNTYLNNSGTYTLIARENGCVSDELSINVIIEDCDPCDDGSSTTSWTKVPASMDAFPSIRDYEIGGSLVSGRDLEDFVYYNNTQQDVRLIKNNGDGLFEEEVILFDLPVIGSIVSIDIADIDQDGLNEIITYQHEIQSGTNDGDTVTISIFKNLDDYSFENRLSVIEDSGLGYDFKPVQYVDLDNQGFLDIVPYFGAIYFTENWEENSLELPVTMSANLIEDFNEDGLLDILGNENQLLINNGNRTFSLSMIDGYAIPVGLYDSETGVFTDGYATYQITTGNNPSVEFCNDPAINSSFSFFFANINSSSTENGVITANGGFHIFDTPLTCENTFNYKSIFDFVPDEDGKIDINGNGYTDFITVEDGEIFAWINPNDKPKVRGTAFIDNNGDGELNENDSPLRNVLISIEPGNLSVLTNNNGNYQFAVPEGTYTLTANVNEGEWVVDELIIENVEVIEPCNLGFDFGFEPDPTPIPSVNLSMVNTIARCDFEVKFTITVENTGTEPLGGKLQFEFDDKTSFFSTEITGASVVGNKVIANIGPLTPFQPRKYEVKVKMPSGSSVLPILGFKASLLNDAEEAIATYGYEEQLRCSYDPNDKREFPDRVGDENLTLMDEDIEYTIRFQNNGNDTAYNVKIVDPLDVNIDPTSIRLVGSSHAAETCIEGTDLIFLFENIYLVDSTTNYPGSQGYVTFKCNALEGRAEFTEVNNSADIFFDTNLPIATNQTINTLVSELCTNKSTVVDMYICDGEEYMGQTESGTYTESFDLLFGCDSLVTINLTVQGITYSQQSIAVCGGGVDILIGTEMYYIESNTTIIDTVMNDQECITNVLKYDISISPNVLSIDELQFCTNQTGSVPDGLEGIWSVDDESIIEIDDQGTITAIGSGMTTLSFFDEASGCIEDIQVEVFPVPVINNEGSDAICINETNQLTTDSEGTWVSSDPNVATITNDGLVSGVGEGSASFMFTSLTSECANSIELIVLPASDSNCTVSTNDLSSESVKIYPNPATESLFIESEDVWNAARLINSQGQIVLSIGIAEYERKKQIDLRDVIPGLYFVAIERESGVVVKKFVVD